MNAENSTKQLSELQDEIKKLREEAVSSDKDVWDKIHSSAPLITGLLVALIGALATHVYRERSLALENVQKEKEIAVLQVQIIQGFMPEFQSKDPTRVETAILVISALGNSKLATDLATLYRNTGSVRALGRIGQVEGRDVVKSAIPTLIETLKDKDPVVRESAVQSLAMISGPNPEVVQAISSLLRDSNSDVRASALRAISELGEIPPECTSQLTEQVLFVLESDVNSFVIESTLRTLTALYPKLTEEQLHVIDQRMVKGPEHTDDPFLVIAYAEALADMGDDLPMDLRLVSIDIIAELLESSVDSGYSKALLVQVLAKLSNLNTNEPSN